MGGSLTGLQSQAAVRPSASVSAEKENPSAGLVDGTLSTLTPSSPLHNNCQPGLFRSSLPPRGCFHQPNTAAITRLHDEHLRVLLFFSQRFSSQFFAGSEMS